MIVPSVSIEQYPHHHRVVKWCESQIGVYEVPPHSNRGKQVEYYQSFDFLRGGGYPWCVCFFLAGWGVENMPLPYPTPSVYALEAWARGQGDVWHAPPAQWRRVPLGSGVAFNLGSGHMGVLDYFETINGKVFVHTIDGNTSDQVARRTRPLTEVRGFVIRPARPHPPVIAKKKPAFTVTGSETGHKKLHYTGPLPKSKRLQEWAKKYGAITIRRGKH